MPELKSAYIGELKIAEAPVAGPDVPDKPGMTRTDRRKARTRANLVRAAQQLIAEGRSSVPIREAARGQVR